MVETTDKNFLKALQGEVLDKPPLWMMRQAGRYLDEYKKVREQAGSFLNLCYNPELACEVTLQPIRRFGFDASILFADILVVPDALGQEVRFETGEGPRLDPITNLEGLKHLDLTKVDEKFNSIAETVKLIRAGLPKETTLIGFCGSPWTVATYMVAGKGTVNQAPARTVAYENPEFFEKLMDILVEASIDYLSRQVEAGAEVLQLFDSWAGSLPVDQFESWVISPTMKIVNVLRAKYPHVPIIGFPRGAGPLYTRYVEALDIQGVSIDETIDPKWARDNLPSQVTLQGNVDSLALMAGGDALKRQVDAVFEAWSGRPFVVNLGHGIQQFTPVEHVEQFIKLVRR